MYDIHRKILDPGFEGLCAGLEIDALIDAHQELWAKKSLNQNLMILQRLSRAL